MERGPKRTRPMDWMVRPASSSIRRRLPKMARKAPISPVTTIPYNPLYNCQMDIREIFERWHNGAEPPIAKLVGFHLTEYEKGRAVFAFEAGPQHANPMGSLHGGILCDVADAAMGTAVATTLNEGESFTT